MRMGRGHIYKYIYIDAHRDSMTDPAQRAESVKNILGAPWGLHWETQKKCIFSCGHIEDILGTSMSHYSVPCLYSISLYRWMHLIIIVDACCFSKPLKLTRGLTFPWSLQSSRGEYNSCSRAGKASLAQSASVSLQQTPVAYILATCCLLYTQPASCRILQPVVATSCRLMQPTVCGYLRSPVDFCSLIVGYLKPRVDPCSVLWLPEVLCTFLQHTMAIYGLMQRSVDI